MIATPILTRGARMSFGETLAGLRERAGLTQVQLAAQAGVSIDSLRRWEQDRNLPRVDDAYRLAAALGVSLDRLIIAKDMMPAEQQPKKGKPGLTGRGRKKGGGK
jgi:transcriptional regulator with XRE-family HTH domain